MRLGLGSAGFGLNVIDHLTDSLELLGIRLRDFALDLIF